MSKINLTTTTQNERITERLIRNWLDSESDIKEPGEGGFKYTEQYNLGGRRPDFLTFHKDDKGPTCIIIEAKDKSKIHSQGEVQVKEYMEMAATSKPSLNIIGIAVSTTPKGNLKITAFHRLGDVVSELKGKADINYLVSQTRKDEEGISKKKAKIATWRETLSSELAQLHEHVRNYCKAPSNEKINLLNGVFIALRSSDFRNNINKYQDIAYSRNIYNAIISVMMAESHSMDQIQNIKDSFAFLDIQTHPTNDLTVPHSVLGDPNIIGQISFNKFLCNFIVKNILKPLENNEELKSSATDISSVTYNEFIKYAKGDGKDLGIVLTPEHIADLMIKLLELKPDDVLLDICTGSGAFLVAGMKEKIARSVNADEENRSIKGLVGVELQPHMHALAVSNLLFNGGDISQLYLGSCYEQKIIDKIKDSKPTKAILNPPYAMYKNKETSNIDLHEWSFTKHALSFLPQGGKLAVIVPTSCGIHNEETNNNLKKELLENNRLDCIIQCADQLFYPTGVVTNIYIFSAGIPHDKKYTTFTYNLKDDGFKINRKLGRKDTGTWIEKENNFFEDYEKFEDGNLCCKVNITEKDEWDYIPSNNCPVLNSYHLFIIKKEFEYVNSLNYQGVNINTSSWKKFKLVDLFEIYKINSRQCQGNIPLVTSSSQNRGFGSKQFTNNGENNIFTIAFNGQPGITFWHKNKVGVNGDAGILKPKFKYTDNICLFLETVITKSFTPKYSYGKKLGLNRITQESIFLPEKDGQPDWEYMENFMNNLIEK